MPYGAPQMAYGQQPYGAMPAGYGYPQQAQQGYNMAMQQQQQAHLSHMMGNMNIVNQRR